MKDGPSYPARTYRTTNTNFFRHEEGVME